ncbi:hypothetical protein LRP60_13725, partial [Cutibacterium acnes]|nr:hypothetical protein [Cutibacterium acnes]
MKPPSIHNLLFGQRWFSSQKPYVKMKDGFFRKIYLSEKGEKHPTCSLFFFSIHPHMQPFEGRIASACSLFFS